MFEEQLALLSKPRPQTLGAFRHVYYNGAPDPFPTLGGSSSTLYDDSDDLVAIKGQERPDRLTSLIQNHFGFLFVCI
jgi:hypothetical protein